MFDKVIVITDRVILDRQLQDTIHQFEHTHGVVATIDEDSQQLADALSSDEAKIIVTTLWKFPFVIEKIAGLPQRRYAVLMDEAHSSQSGEASKEMKAVLGGGDADGGATEGDGDTEPADGQDLLAGAIEASAKARGRQPNLSLFAFTATPKAKTLELFGHPVVVGGTTQPVPFHLYSMRQAIEEGFILDVLAGYTTYDTLFRLEQDLADDPEVESRKAAAKIAAFVSLHPENMAQRARIVVDHFRRHTAHQIGGRAKAMVVCRSRLHAVRMKLAIDRCIADDGLNGLSALVAFSGTVTDPETATDWTEPGINGFPESQTAERFASDDHQLLVVAEKFQTGFDQPLLHTMYVDKKLAGVNAVQTLSRLNRTHPDKTSTFVLDFANDAEAVRSAFEPYYDVTTATPTDPNLVFDARNALDGFGILRDAEVDAFAALWFGGNAKDRTLHAKFHDQLDPARDRFVSDLDDDDQDQCRQALERFVKLYAFLAQVLPLASTELEKKYLYCRFLRLPKQEAVALDLDLDLTHLRVAEHETRSIELTGDATAAAFLNSRFGGTLLIGVAERPDGTGEVLGLGSDFATLHKQGKDDADLFQLHLTQLVANAVGLAAAANVTTRIDTVDGLDLCRVHVELSGHPVRVKDVFFIRLNNGTRAIEDDLEIERYIAHRWGGA